jgi:predicted transcriptional regulator of viral defense system
MLQKAYMSRKDRDRAKKIFHKNHGILRVSNATRLGIQKHILYEMYQSGELVKESRGLYSLSNMQPLGNPDLIHISLLVPKGVICLISALHFYELTTQIPHSVYVALPKNILKPRIDYPPLEVFWLLPKPYSAGIDEIMMDGLKVKIYNKEKTIVDCFKFRKRIGEEIALEALKDYLGKPRIDIHQLMKYAKINRVERIITPYIKGLL